MNEAEIEKNEQKTFILNKLHYSMLQLLRCVGIGNILAFFIFIGFVVIMGLFFFQERQIQAQTLNQKMTGTFLWHPFLSHSEIKPLFQEISDLGMDTVIIGQTMKKTQSCSSNQYEWEQNKAVISEIIQEASHHGIGVYIGLINSLEACSLFEDETNATQDARRSAELVSQLLLENEQDLQTIKGWYIPIEPSLTLYNQEKLEKVYDYYETVSAAVDQAQPQQQRPILLAPMLNGSQNKNPTGYLDVIALALKQHGIDIQVWQDGVGGVSTPIFGWTRENPTYQTRDYYQAIAQAIGSESLWADIEIFSCPSPDTESVWSATGCALDWNLYRPSSISRILEQMKYAEPASKTVVWIQHTMMGKTDDNKMAESARLHDSYLAANNLNNLFLVHPKSYRWTTIPHTSYGDRGGELFDMITADPRNYFDSNWIGITGSAEFIAELEKPTAIRWIAAHVLHEETPSISFPQSLVVECSQDGENWTTVGTWDSPFQTNSFNQGLRADYVFSNTQELAATCSFLKVRLQNVSTQMTFVSEIEIIGDGNNDGFLYDLNNDGQIDMFDYNAFLSFFITQDKKGDLNADGQVTIHDYNDLLLHI